MKKEYDTIIVGSGLYGATYARLATDHGKRCLVLERRHSIGGNVRDEWQDGINVHLHGAHVFHTDDEHVWSFVNRYSPFEPYVHTVMARNAGKMYHLPFGMDTFHDVYGTVRPEEVEVELEKEHKKEYYPHPKNLEEKAINMVGRTIYELLVKGYTEKQWGRRGIDLPPELVNRLPIRKTYDNRYFSNRFQGIPTNGYSAMMRNMLAGIEVRTDTDFLQQKDHWVSRADNIIYTGSVDELMDYGMGELEYRSLRFETTILSEDNYQGMAVVNETGSDVGYTRTIEHKHFYYGSTQGHTIITHEYPRKWERGLIPYYPLNDERNNSLYRDYCERAKSKYPTIKFGGRLGLYRYYDMDAVISLAMRQYSLLEQLQ